MVQTKVCHSWKMRLWWKDELGAVGGGQGRGSSFRPGASGRRLRLGDFHRLGSAGLSCISNQTATLDGKYSVYWRKQLVPRG